jgi:tetratricopeptide (TPR) repeat protein
VSIWPPEKNGKAMRWHSKNYRSALERKPENLEYRLRYERARLRAALAHFDRGRRTKTGGQFEEALAEFQIALTIGPSLASAAQEGKGRSKDDC